MYLKNLAVQEWTDVIDVIYEVLSLENTAWGPDVLKHQGPPLGPSDANANISQGLGRDRTVLWRFQEDNLVSLSSPRSLIECKASTENFRHMNSKRTHPPGHHLRSGTWWTVFSLKGEKGAHFFSRESFWHNSFPRSCQASVQTPPHCGAWSMGMFSSAPREMSACNPFCSHPAALVSDFLTTL